MLGKGGLEDKFPNQGQNCFEVLAQAIYTHHTAVHTPFMVKVGPVVVELLGNLFAVVTYTTFLQHAVGERSQQGLGFVPRTSWKLPFNSHEIMTTTLNKIHRNVSSRPLNEMMFHPWPHHFRQRHIAWRPTPVNNLAWLIDIFCHWFNTLLRFSLSAIYQQATSVLAKNLLGSSLDGIRAHRRIALNVPIDALNIA